MVTLEMKQADFVDMIEKMSIPTKSRKNKFFFPGIVLTIHPDNEIEWIGRSNDVLVWVRWKCATLIDTSESVQIPIDVPHFLKYLKTFRSQEIISFTHYPFQDDILTTKRQKGKMVVDKECILRKNTDLTVRGILEEFPFRLEKDTEIILFKNGLLRPTISGSCDVSLFKNSIPPVKMLQKEWKKENKENSKKRNKEKKVNKLSLYNIYVDENLRQIKVVEGNEHINNSIVDCLTNANVRGRGELHYTAGFAEVVGLLSGEIKFYAVDYGPLFIMQDTNQMKLRYLIAPTPRYGY